MYQFNIHIIVSQKTFYTTTIYILFSLGLESAQLVLKLDIGHFDCFHTMQSAYFEF